MILSCSAGGEEGGTSLGERIVVDERSERMGMLVVKIAGRMLGSDWKGPVWPASESLGRAGCRC